MERTTIQQLKEWKSKSDRKPLLIHGARQVGKTWLLREFAKREYRKEAYIVCRKNELARQLFSQDFNIDRILRGLRALSGVDITPHDTLIILDEVQDIPEALESLKYFKEEAPEYHIAVAGSLLGISLHQDVSYPVGKVNVINLYPMNFEEFLLAKGENEACKLLQSRDYDTLNLLHEKYTDLLRQYYYVGGMPEAVKKYVETGALQEVRDIQEGILQGYGLDFSKHAPKEQVPRIRMVWSSIPSQLFKENKKFIFSAIKGSRRASDYENALQWLKNAGLIYQIPLLRTQKIPTSVYEEKSIFKIYMIDIGLLGAKAGLNHNAIISGSTLFVEFKGALAEQYTCQELVAEGEFGIHYYANENSSNEVEFLIDNGLEIIPVEIKSGINVKAKSLKAYMEKFHPKLSFRVSRKGYEEQDNLINLPLAEISNIGNIVKRKVKI